MLKWKITKKMFITLKVKKVKILNKNKSADQKKKLLNRKKLKPNKKLICGHFNFKTLNFRKMSEKK